jgi:hypothetical protein
MWTEYCNVPLMTLGFENNYDVSVKVHAGGLSGVRPGAQAICLGVARTLGSVWLKSQVEWNRSVPVLLLFGYKGTRTEWLQLGNILLRSGTIPLQKINRTEPLRSHPALTVTLRSVHSATKQKTEPLRSRLPNTEQSGSVPRIRNGTAPFYLAPQPNTTLVKN